MTGISFILASFLIVTNLPTTQKFAVEQLVEKGIDARLTDRGIVFFAPEFLFDTGSSHVSDQAQAQVRSIIGILELKGINDDLVYFEGHTDTVGDADFNLKLGTKRARSIEKVFLENGLDPGRTISVSYGETIPVSDDLKKNRRVEIVVVDSKGF